MPTVTDENGITREISREEFREIMAQEDAKITSVKQVIRDGETGQVVQEKEILRKDGTLDLFAGMFDDDRDMEELMEDAEDGDEDAMRELANRYLNGSEEVDPDPQKAVFWYTKLAETDDANAQFDLALHHAKGHGTPRDFKKAIYWMERAAENGDEDAPRLIETYKDAAAKMEKAASGDAQAQADMVEILTLMAGSLEQAGREKDYAEAFDMAQKSAAQNNGDGIWALALAYEHGRGVEEDVDKALELYRKGTELGHAKCMHNLGCYYMRGDYLQEDKPRAIELCRKAAEKGYDMAEFFMAKVYETGDGVEEDLDEALRWGEKAAEHGSAEIQYQVAKLYTYVGEDGDMINPDRARYWLEKAAERGHQMAYDMLNFAPMWMKDGFELDEDAADMDEDEPAWMKPMFRLTEIAFANGMPASPPGAAPDFDEVLGFAQYLAENGDDEAREALAAFLAAMEEEDEEEGDEDDSLDAEAEEYLDTMLERFAADQLDWERFPDNVYQTLMSIMSRNVKSMEDIEKNKPAAQEYLASAKEQIQARAAQFETNIREFDEKLEYFRDQNLNEFRMGLLTAHFAQWVDYAQVLEFKINEQKLEFRLPEIYITKKKQWLGEEPEAAPAEEPAKAPAEPEQPKSVADPAQEIRSQREAELEKIRKQLTSEFWEESGAIAFRTDKEKDELNRQITDLQFKIASQITYQNSLGFFKFAEKKAAKAKLEALENTLAERNEKLAQMEPRQEQQREQLKQRIRQKWERERQAVRTKFPTSRGISLFDIVLLGMDPGSKYTIQELAELPDVPEEITPNLLNNKIVSPLVSQGKLRRVTENGRTYFQLT